MTKLSEKVCEPCKGGIPPLTSTEIKPLAIELGNNWEVIENHHLFKKYEFPDFVEALAFVNKVGELAEDVGHHPNFSFTWGYVEITIWTHKINGLNEADFILAAKIETLFTN